MVIYMSATVTKPHSNGTGRFQIKARRVSAPRVALHAVLTAIALFILLPVILIITSSLMHEQDIFISGYTYFPAQGFTLDAYKQVFMNSAQLVNSYMVTVSVTALGTALGLCLTLPLGYILSRKDFLYRKQLSFYIFFTMIFSPGMVPSYLMMVGWFRLYNNYLVELLPGLCSGFLILLAKGMMQGIPFELIESAKLDGAGELKTFTGIVLPLSKQAAATVGLFIAISYWNDWMTCYLYITNDKLYSLQYLVIQIQQSMALLANMSLYYTGIQAHAPLYTTRMAMCVLVTLPILFAYPFIQKFFQKGLTVGSVKG